MAERVFVTVGSTQFDDLVKEVTKRSILETLYMRGFRFLTIQIGKGTFVPEDDEFHGIKMEVFRYKETLKEDLERADLVISHAGACSCIEALEANKPMIAVINHSLMHNHQKELAEALSEHGFCKWCYTSTLYTTLEEFSADSLKPYKPGEPQRIVDYINSVFHLEAR